jgi:hypothetical protein
MIPVTKSGWTQKRLLKSGRRRLSPQNVVLGQLSKLDGISTSPRGLRNELMRPGTEETHSSRRRQSLPRYGRFHQAT